MSKDLMCVAPEEEFYSSEPELSSPVVVNPLASQAETYGNSFMQEQLNVGTANSCDLPMEVVPEEIGEVVLDEEPAPEQTQDEDSGWGIMDWVHGALDIAGLIPGVGEIADGINAVAYAAEGDKANAALSAAAMVPFLGWGATTAKVGGKVVKAAKVGGKAVKAAKAGDKASDVAKAAKTLTPRAARREAMRKAGIPTSQQPIRQRSAKANPTAPNAGRQYDYNVNGKPHSVQHSLTDDVPGHGPHWEAGPVKPGGQTDGVGRPRLTSDKVKVEE